MIASPQAENGHIDIANEIAEALMKVNLSPYESRVLWFLFRKTYGWHKKKDWITLSQFSKDIGLDRRLIHRAIKRLLAKKMIIIDRDDKNHISYGFQKDYTKWKGSSKKMTVISRDDQVSSVEMIRVSSVEIPTKETITKETITKEIYSPDFLEFYSAYPNRKEKPAAFKRWKQLKKSKTLPSIQIILEAIEKQKEWRENANGYFRPEWKHPATWLNKGCWEDELEKDGNKSDNLDDYLME